MPPKQNLSRMGSRRIDSNNNLQMLSNFKLPSTATLGSLPSQYHQNNRYAVCDTDSQCSDGMSIASSEESSPVPTRHSSPSNNAAAAAMRSKYNASPLHSRTGGVLTMSMSPLNNLNKTPPPGIFIEQKSSAVFSKTKNLNTSPSSPNTSPHKDLSSPSLYFQRKQLSPTHHHQSQYVKKGLELASEVYQIAPKRNRSSKTRLVTRRTSMQSSTLTTK
ncbi:predicted protein [Naegleria gruberi]|uniref:Predicted protein n=1 Tax=Naegleria gruberi TaxID=5762 RepID=D2W3Q3_NAEGR|nr:uncharacterized protein NAEGRDRAFT_76028 [Naegleria gruberi]EFC36279.1 predicted protein [Naegleria gruberi]|eukprot:XP_002669023.1 predicted protein [Naegleria gruberi strain NEG-M]